MTPAGISSGFSSGAGVRRVLLFSVALVFSSVFFIDFCAWLFQCGCQSLWAGAEETCNIHIAHSRHCPWCVHPYAGGLAAFGAVTLAQIGAMAAPFGWGLATRFGLALSALPLVAGTIGLVQGWWWGYWA